MRAVLLHELVRTDFESLTPWTIAYISFNAIEAIAWFTIAAIVARRALRGRAGLLEWLYAASFIIFGVTDLLEIVAMPIWLLAVKGIVLGAILLLRAEVLTRHPGARF